MEELEAYFNEIRDKVEKVNSDINNEGRNLQQTLNYGFDRVLKHVLRNYDLSRSVSNTAERYLIAMQQALNELQNDIRESFDQAKDFIKQAKVENLILKIYSFIEHIMTERNTLKQFTKEQLLHKLDGRDNIIDRLNDHREPRSAAALHAVLNGVMNEDFAVPANTYDHLALIGLDLLCAGTRLYYAVMIFILESSHFVSMSYYNKNFLEKYNNNLMKVKVVRQDIENTFSGKKGLIVKLQNLLYSVQSLHFIKHERSDVLKFITREREFLTIIKSKFHEQHNHFEGNKVGKITRYDFDNAPTKIPVGKWRNGRYVSYAMQFKYENEIFPVSSWFRKVRIQGKTNPLLLIGTETNERTRLIFRKFDNDLPELVGILQNSTQGTFQDIDRDLYEAVAMPDENEAQDEIEYFMSMGANVNAVYENNRQAIHAVIGTDSSTRTGILIEAGANVNAIDVNGYSPLHVAAELGHFSVVDVLIKSGIDVNAFTNSFWTALHIAAHQGHAEFVAKLMQIEEVDTEARTKRGFTPLHIATSSNEIEVIDALRQSSKIDVNSRSDENLTPLHVASVAGHVTAAESLLKNDEVNVNIEAKGKLTPLHFATLSGNMKIFNTLVTHRDTDPNKKALDGWTSLHLAVILKHEELVLKLLEMDTVEKNIRGKNGLTPLHLAAFTGQINIVSYLHNVEIPLSTPENYGNTALHFAAMQGHLSIVEYLVKKKIDIDAVQKNGDTPLSLASLNGRLTTIEYLVDAGASVNIKNKADMSPVDLAAWSGHLEPVEYLISHGANLRPSSLHLPVYSGHLDVLKYLLENGANLNSTDKFGRVILYTALEGGHLGIFKYLVERKHVNVSTTDKNGNNLIHVAAFHGFLEVVKYLVNSGANATAVNHYSKTPLHLAVWNGHLKMVQYLAENISSNEDIQKEHGEDLLYYAALNGQKDVVRYLIRKKFVSTNIRERDGWTPMLYAAYKGKWDTVKLLAKNGSNVNTSNDYGNILHFASRDGEIKIIDYFIKFKTNIDQVDKHGRTPMFLAARYDYLDIVKLLIEKGANLYVTDKHDMTILHTALLSGSLDITRYLMDEKYFDINFTTNKIGGVTLLHIAAEKGFLKAVEYLTEQGAIIDSYDENNVTPLLKAATRHKWPVVKHLLEKGANPNLADKNGITALHQAVKSGALDVVQLLLKHGANLTAVDSKGRTPLHYAAWSSFSHMVEYLFKWADTESENTDETDDYINMTDNEGNTFLHYAAAGGNINIFKYFIDKKSMDFNRLNKRNKSAFDVASENGFLQGIQYLINEKGASHVKDIFSAAKDGSLGVLKYMVEDKQHNISAEDDNGKSLLHYAAENGHLNIIKYLVGEKNIDKYVKDSFGNIALHYSALKGQENTTLYMLNIMCFDRNIRNNIGDTPLHLATQVGHLNIVKLLLKTSSDFRTKNNLGNNVLHVAALNNRTNIVRYLINISQSVSNHTDRNPSPDLTPSATKTVSQIATNHSYRNFSPLDVLHADYRRDLTSTGTQTCPDVTEDLVLTEADLKTRNNDNNTALHLASSTGSLDIVKDLVELVEIDKNSRGFEQRTPFMYAAESGYINTVKYLIDKGANYNDTDKKGSTGLHLAARNGKLSVLEYLIESVHGDVNSKGFLKRTPLMYAVEGGDINVVTYILSKGVNHNAKDEHGNTAFHIAAWYGRIKLVKYFADVLLFNISEPGSFLRAPLMFAVRSGCLPTVKYLLTKGADPKTKDVYDNTVVHLAAQDGKLNILRYFIEQLHANASGVNSMGRTAFMNAAKAGHVETVKYLLQRGSIYKTKDNDGNSAIHLASQDGKLLVVKYFLEQLGADVNAQGAIGRIPLMNAAEGGSLETFNYLLTNGGYYEARDKEGSTALHLAARGGRLNIVKHLIEGNPKLVDVLGAVNRTVLIYACEGSVILLVH